MKRALLFTRGPPPVEIWGVDGANGLFRAGEVPGAAALWEGADPGLFFGEEHPIRAEAITARVLNPLHEIGRAHV